MNYTITHKNESVVLKKFNLCMGYLFAVNVHADIGQLNILPIAHKNDVRIIVLKYLRLLRRKNLQYREG